MKILISFIKRPVQELTYVGILLSDFFSAFFFKLCEVKFVQDSNILDLLNLNDTRDLMDDLNNDSKILGASMNQLGRSVDAFCKEGDLKEVIERFKTYKPNVKIFDSVINDKVFDIKFE